MRESGEEGRMDVCSLGRWTDMVLVERRYMCCLWLS